MNIGKQINMDNKYRNVVWWVGVKTDEFKEKYGGHAWIDISRKSWEVWCEQNDVEFVAFEEPIEKDVRKYRINWQKSIFVFDELERRGIDYDQICLVDSSSIIKWDAPNFFEISDHKFCAVKETDNLKWVLDSIIGYESMFNFKLDSIKYFSSGFLIFNKGHKELFNSFKQFYIDNVDEFVKRQDITVRKGTEQTPINYWTQLHDVDVKLLPPTWKLTHIHRKEMFGHNWQLNEDKTPFFIKYGYVWFFTGFDKGERSKIMEQVWQSVKHFYDNKFILNRIANKNTDKDTTSGKFKEDILRIFGSNDFKTKTLLELGCNTGNTTRVYAEIFKSVIGVEHNIERLEIAKRTCSDVNNIKFISADVYSASFKLPKADVVHIDAGHTHDQVAFDIERCISELDKPYLIFDDCCKKLFPDGNYGNTIRTAVDGAIAAGELELICYIGANNGYKSGNGKVLTGTEGMICKVI